MDSDVPDGYYGVIAEENLESDYQLGGFFDLPVAANTFDSHKIQYNQNDVWKYSCTIHGSIGAVSDLTGYAYTTDERKALWAAAVAKGANPQIGWYINQAVDLVRNDWNALPENKDQQLISFTTQVGSPEFNAMLDKGYSMVVGFQGDSNFYKDITDGSLDNVKLGNFAFAHCVRITKKDDLNLEMMVDNYLGDGHNTWTIPIANLPTLIKLGFFFRNAFLFAFKKDYDAYQQTLTVPIWAQVSVQKAQAKGLSIDNLGDNLSIADLEALFVTLGALSTKTGMISRLRALVLLDRLKLL